MTTKPNANPMRRRRSLAFRAVAVAIGLLPFLVMEVTLRLLGLGHPDHHDDPFVGFSAVRPLFVLDAGGTRFETATSRLQFFQPDSFAARKSPREFRIFCLGGSTVQGRPFAIETAFSTWLELSLNAADPSRSWEVVNCGGVSYASYRLAPLVEELLGHKPDLFILYTGHNEFLEDRTYEALKDASPLLRRPLEWASNLRTFVLLRELAARWRPGPNRREPRRALLPEEVDTILDYRDGLASYHRDPTWRREVVAHYGYNLRRMIALAREAGVPLILVNPVANLETPPFKAEYRDGLPKTDRLRLERLWDEARGLYDSNLIDAVDRLRQAVAIDHQHAGLRYTLGRGLQQIGRYGEARAELRAALDLDICPLRMISPLHDALLDTARETDTPVVDLAPIFEARSLGGIVGDRWLVDHVHPSIQGHKLIASALFDRMAALGFVHPVEGWRADRDARFAEHIEALDPLYFALAQRRLERLRLWASGRGVKLRAPRAGQSGRDDR